MARKILITGGAGFIGTHLVETLADAHQLVVFDNLKRDSLKDSSMRHHPNIKMVHGDIREPRSIAEAFGDCDTVIHCAAIAGIDSVGLSPMDTMDVNLMGSHHLLEIAKNQRLSRFIQFSTSEVYGPYTYLGTENDLTTQGPIGQMRWAYAVSKLAAEHYAFCYRQKHQLPVLSVRPFNIYGPGQVGEGAIQKFIQRATRGQDLEIYGDGSQVRSWCFISDFIKGVILCLEKDAAVGEVFNLGNPQTGITTSELAHMVIRLAGSKSKIVFRPPLAADVRVRIPSIQKARELLGFQPEVDLTEGLRRTIEWHQKRIA